MTRRISVRVPASSANLGPGFDAQAVALSLALRVDTVAYAGTRVVTTGLGGGELPGDDSNLIWRSVTAYCDRFGAATPDVTLHVHNDIPLERGLGSSAAAAVAGAVVGRELAGAGGTDDDLIGLAADLEGHPDNAAAALLGGVVLCVDGGARRLEPTDTLRPVVAVPSTRQSTEAARGVLPASVTLHDAAANSARAAMVLAGLTGALAWEPSAMVDVFHEPPRLELMADSGTLVTALRTAGIGACLSGAGPTVLAIVHSRDDRDVDKVRSIAGDGFDVRPLHWDRAGAVVYG